MAQDLSRLPTGSRFSSPDDHPGLEELVAYLDNVERLRPFRVLQAKADEWLAVELGQSILDLGCGLGRATREAARRTGPAGQAVGVDISQALLRIAETRSVAAPAPRYIHGDAAALPFPAGAFDRVRAERLLMHVANPAAVLAEIARLLRPGGRAVLIEPDWHSLEIAHADQPACEALTTVFGATIKNPTIGSKLAAMCEAAGLVVSTTEVHIWQSSVLTEIDLTLQLDRVAEIAVRLGFHPGPPDTLTRSIRVGSIGASLTLTLLLATKPDVVAG